MAKLSLLPVGPSDLPHAGFAGWPSLLFVSLHAQASWVKMGPQHAASLLKAGCNDMGGVLMNVSVDCDPPFGSWFAAQGGGVFWGVLRSGTLYRDLCMRALFVHPLASCFNEGFVVMLKGLCWGHFICTLRSVCL